MNPELIERYRDINVEDNWWEDEIHGFTEELFRRTGVTVSTKDVHFSGFWSQGDGASFVFSAELLADFLLRRGWQDKYPALFADENATFSVSRPYTPRYYHSGTMYAEVEHRLDDWITDDFMKAVEQARHDAACVEEEACAKDIQDFFRAEADKLYCSLEAVYEYLTSDEAVWDTIVANGLDQFEEEEEDGCK